MRAEHSIRLLAARVQGLRGWRRRGAAFAAGSLSVLAMAPFFAWPILWLTLPVFVWLIDGAMAEGGVGCAVALRNGRHLCEAWPWSVCRKSQIVKPTA